jgi:ABC-type lipoprotein export system ATPase subunit
MSEPLIALRGIGKTYRAGDQAIPVLADVDLTIEAGEYVAIMGRSGSGKSTLMNLIGLLDRPTAGSYRFEGREVGALDDAERSRLRGDVIGFVFQRFHLLPSMDVRRNVELPMKYGTVPPAERTPRAIQLLERVGLGHRLGHRPAQLSGGEQQRVAIARSLANRPRLILADEPTGNLDTAAHERVMELFAELRRELGITVILVTHDPDVGHAAERCIEVSDGRVARARSASAGHGPHGSAHV